MRAWCILPKGYCSSKRTEIFAANTYIKPIYGLSNKHKDVSVRCDLESRSSTEDCGSLGEGETSLGDTLGTFHLKKNVSHTNCSTSTLVAVECRSR